MNAFNKITSNPVKALKDVFISSKILDFVNIRNIQKTSEEETIDFLQNFPAYRYLLDGQYFYLKTCGDNNGIHTNIPVDIEIGKNAVAVCKYLFRKVRVNEIILNGTEKTIWLIVVNGVSDEGRLIAENYKNEIIERLYLNASLSTSDMLQGLYEVVGDATLNRSINDRDFIVAMGDKNFRNMDVSSMSFEQCSNSSLIAYIATHKSKVYLSIDETDGRQFKILYWK